MADFTQQYDPGLFFANVAGIQINHVSDGTFFEISYQTEGFKTKVGGAGDAMRIRVRDDRGMFKATLLPGGRTNDLLMALAIADRQFGRGVGIFTFRDMGGTSVAIANNAWIKKIPDLKRGTDAPPVEWEFELFPLVLSVGGNR